MAATLAQALEKEHEDIDAGISAFTAGLEAGTPPVDTMMKALAAHRRHIYLEEVMLFPPLRAGGLFAAILVMLREHGEMWQLMDELEPLVVAGGTDAAVAGLCEKFVAVISAHNLKEEATVYSKADEVLSAPATDELRAFMASGSMPDGWVCEKG
ncbi:MAG: hemerythrin domain-containing protein [Nakamurella sp.]